MELLAQADRDTQAWAPVYFVLMLVFLAIVLLIHFGRRASFRKKLEQVARHLRGRVVWRSGLSEVHFEHQGFPAEIRFARQGRQNYHTQVEIRWSGPHLRCEIYPENFLASLRKLMGMQDIVIGSPQFDSQFVITGDDEPGIKALLNGQVQSAIFHLAGCDSGMHVQMSSRSLVVTCGELLTDFGRLTHFVRLCGDLCDAAVSAQGLGIEFLDREPIASTPGVPGEAHCMVCGEALASQVVYCRSCKTPHHRDCWSYGGGCSTYGCGEKKYVSKL